MENVCKRSERATENEKFTVSEEILNFMVMGLCDILVILPFGITHFTWIKGQHILLSICY